MHKEKRRTPVATRAASSRIVSAVGWCAGRSGRLNAPADVLGTLFLYLVQFGQIFALAEEGVKHSILAMPASVLSRANHMRIKLATKQLPRSEMRFCAAICF